MPKLLTALSVEQMKPNKKRRLEIADAGEKNLYLHVQPSGGKSWVLMITRPNGKLGKLVLGSVDLSGRDRSDKTPAVGMPLTLADARWLAADMKKQRKDGDIITADRDRKADAKTKTTEPGTKFAAVAMQFIDEYARPETRRWLETAHYLGLDYKDVDKPVLFKNGVADQWKDKEATAIGSDEIYRMIDDTKRHGIPGLPCRKKGISNSRGRAMARALSGMFGWALQHRIVKVNPSVGVYVPPAGDSKGRPLSRDEVIAFWHASDRLSEPFGAVVKLLLLTGSRLREIANMRRRELTEQTVALTEDANGNVTSSRPVRMLTIPGSRTKNKLEHMVPLPPMACGIIDGVKKIAGKPGYVFTTTGRSPVSGFSKTKRRLDELMRADLGEEFLPWKLHWLRKTFSTMLNESPPKGLRIAPHVVEALINHISGHKAGVAGDYNSAAYLPEKVVALERWANHIDGMVEGRKANVTPLFGVGQ